MAHPLHCCFGSAHLFLLKVALCCHARVVLSVCLEKIGNDPSREDNHTNVRLIRTLI